LTASISWVCGQLFSSLFFFDFHRTNFSGFRRIDALMEQIKRDRAEMSEEIARLRRQFSIDLEMVAHELRETKLELDRMRLINQFANSEHRDLAQSLH
jgi:hypothetical protein